MKILAVTGIRSEYDYLYPVLKELKLSKHDIRIVVTGAHLSNNHNNTWKLIEKDNFIISDKIDSLLSTDRISQRSKAVALIINGLTQTVERENPDILIVNGDREESIATTIVGNYMNKIVVHIGGGDSTIGNSDDPLRFAVSKLAHVHCCTSYEYKKNLLRVGEEKFRVFNTGNPSFSNIKNVPTISKKALFKNLDITDLTKDYLVLLKHPLSSKVKESYNYMKKSIKAVEKFCNKNNYLAICIAPNSDPGSYDMKKAINEYKNEKWFYYFETLPRKYFINLIRNMKVLVGNSSMGLLEAPYYKKPVVNIGTRQTGRLNAGNVKFTNYNQESIIKSIHQACYDKKYLNKIKNLKNPYGDHNSAKKIKNVIEAINLNDMKWYVKKSVN